MKADILWNSEGITVTFVLVLALSVSLAVCTEPRWSYTQSVSSNITPADTGERETGFWGYFAGVNRERCCYVTNCIALGTQIRKCVVLGQFDTV